MSLTDKTAILFGAGAIASGYAALFAEQKMNIAVVSRGESCEKLATAISGMCSRTVRRQPISVIASTASR
jgi:predicted dinucleotide-binding enzyme